MLPIGNLIRPPGTSGARLAVYSGLGDAAPLTSEITRRLRRSAAATGEALIQQKRSTITAEGRGSNLLFMITGGFTQASFSNFAAESKKFLAFAVGHQSADIFEDRTQWYLAWLR